MKRIKATAVKDNGHIEDDTLDAGTGSKSLSFGDFSHAFMHHEMASAVNMLVKRGEDVNDLWMRAHFPSGRKPGHIQVIATACVAAKAAEFSSNIVEDEVMNVMAGFTAVDNERVELLVKAIIGDESFKAGKNKGAGAWLREKAGLE
jgi:hypothetical protein